MSNLNRRSFLKQTALTSTGMALAPNVLAAPTILTPRRTSPSTARGTLRFEPHFVQHGKGPHLADFVYATNTRWDIFRSNIGVRDGSVEISDTVGEERFGINVRWHVEDFGYVFITADNGGDFYSLPPEGGSRAFNLNDELARSRVVRNRTRLSHLKGSGWVPSREVLAHVDLSESYLEDAAKAGKVNGRGSLAQEALYYALWASEKMELEHARFVIERRGHRSDFYFGCDARSFYHMQNPDLFLDRFEEVFDYATITYVWEHTQGLPDFEPREGEKDFTYRDFLLKRLRERNITVEGRPLFWFHTWVTPDWIKGKSYDELLKYVEKHTRETVGHYTDEIYAWEIVNEFHDWANEVQLNPEQIVELTKLACDVAKDTNPNVHRLVNHCCPFAEYVQMGEWSGQPATYPQRTPWEFTRDLADAGVDFTLIGQQMYFPGHDLQNIILLLERFEEFGRPVQLSEVGCGSAPEPEAGGIEAPPDWHRHWDEELQADWLEAIYTLGYSKPWIEAANWFDFVDPHHYIPAGGLLRDIDGAPKLAYQRLLQLQQRWRDLPATGGGGK